MTTLSGRPHAALMVIDVQKGVVEGIYQRDAVIANIAALVDKARGAAVPIVWVQHSDAQLERGSEAWQYGVAQTADVTFEVKGAAPH